MNKYMLALAWIVLATGCEKEECFAPSLTQNLRNKWVYANTIRSVCLAEAQDAWENCTKNAGGDTCQEEFNLDTAWCMYYHAEDVNNAVAAICCARPFIVEGTPNDGENFVLAENEEDTDGDGISDFKEFEMGMNPCSQYSHSCEVRDGTLDYDGDGVVDADDDDPTCNPQLDLSCLLM